MKAMILAAGRGERMRPLTDQTPKPLLQAGKHKLIEYHLLNLAAAGFKDVVINIAWLGQQIIDALGNGSDYGLNIQYSDEGEHALETGGGIYNALHLLGEKPFLVINGDIHTDYPLQRLNELTPTGLAHLVFVPNPEHNSAGDFYIQDNQLALTGNQKYTFSGIGVYKKEFFPPQENSAFPLAPLFRQHAAQKLISAELYQGPWQDIGTIDRLEKLKNRRY
ncbi:MAG: nucleotidyltransferase family protein [Gammaproteobacteria bacterium]|nr:nucleotidyltransferase family protein [Gammaproteobacteria bacterium]